MKKVFLALCGALYLVTTSSALPPAGLRRIVTFAANVRLPVGTYVDELGVHDVYKNRASQHVYPTMAALYEEFHLTSNDGEVRTLEALYANGAINPYIDSHNQSKMTLYDYCFSSGVNGESSWRLPEISFDYISWNYDADWCYVTVFNQMFWVYNVPTNYIATMGVQTDPFEDIVFFTW